MNISIKVSAGACGHIQLAIWKDGVDTGRAVTIHLDDVKRTLAALDNYEELLVLIRQTIRETLAANPDATKLQLKQAVEAKTYYL